MSDQTNITEDINDAVDDAFEELSVFQDGQDVNSGTWAEQTEDSACGGIDYEEIELPQALHQLISSGGVCLVTMPDNTWSINGFSARLRRGFPLPFRLTLRLLASIFWKPL